MFIVQSQTAPATIQNALLDLMRNDVEGIRVCCAYMTMSGAEILWDGLVRAVSERRAEAVDKTIVAALDFGLTDPRALAFWLEKGSRVLVAGHEMIDTGRLIPRAAFHPKFYLIYRPDGSVGSLVGSANLSNRGLTINAEVGWLEMALENRQDAERAWARVLDSTTVMTDELLSGYRELRDRETPGTEERMEVEPVPDPALGRLIRYPAFADGEIDASTFSQMWIQSWGMQGGAGTQLELPRGAHRFFGGNFAQYRLRGVTRMGEPVLVAGRQTWPDRPLTWHGGNAMERINLPSEANGGFRYAQSLILFRQIAANTFELRVYPWESDSAKAYVEASRRQERVYRVGRNSRRLAGFL